MAKIVVWKRKMKEKDQSRLPRLIHSSSNPEEDFSVTIVSSGAVHAVPDRLLGTRYYFGDPELSRKKPIKSEYRLMRGHKHGGKRLTGSESENVE